MADPVYVLAPEPKWYLVDNYGRPTAGFMYTYSNLNPTEYKPVYSDISGNNPLPQPVPFAANGTAGPIYFEFYSDTPTDVYYLRFYDEDNNFLYDVPNFLAGLGTGGGTISAAFNLKNYVGNNVFLDNYYNSGASDNTGASQEFTASPVPNNTVLAPSNHNSFIDPDIRFFTDGSGGDSTISFQEFLYGASVLTADVTPQYYLQYANTSAGTGENFKGVQFPIQPKVTTLANQVATVTFWARCTIGNSLIRIAYKQFFGTPVTGSPPTATEFTILGGAPVTLTGDWTRYSITHTIPSVATTTVSSTGDDALYLCFLFPNDDVSTIEFTKLSMFLGASAPMSDFTSVQQINALINDDRTGDTKSGMRYNSSAPGGWVKMIDGTVGPATATVGSTPIARANNDCWFLYSDIWNNTSTTNCPIYTSAGVASTKGSTAADDWDANKRIALPNNAGRVVSNISGSHVIGSSAGEDTHTLTVPEMPSHTHTPNAGNGNIVVPQSGGNTYANGNLGLGASLNPTGGSGAHNNIQPTTYIPMIMKL